ncbi:MAG TPA: response regulator transcription factor [Terriglobia bacterium]|nr:response regulator transcription factor [Terriglobia bacterium]
MSRILIVEDDPTIHRVVRDNLRFEGHDVLSATDGETGYRLAREKRPDVVILDLMLPVMTGLEVCRKLRDEGFIAPIIMLTARGEESDRVAGLDLGADDYVTKPCSILELLARVRAQLRRAGPLGAMPAELQFDDVAVDFRRYEALKGGSPVAMTRKEFHVLRMLAAKAGEVVKRDDIVIEVWGYDTSTGDRVVDNHILKLRQKLDTGPGRLVTVHKVGYKLVLER